MAVNLVSPGVRVREVDLTIGRVDSANNQVGAFAGPFQKGPVDVPVLINTEQELLNVFGKPLEKDSQNEYWYSASSYLSYGGVLRVVRCDGPTLNNANVGTSTTSVSLKITSTEDYNNNHVSDNNWTVAAKNPGSWANGVKVCVIDNFADQTITGFGTTGSVSSSQSLIATKTGNLGITTNIITGINTSLILPGYYVRANINVPANTTVVSVGSSSIAISASTANASPLTGETFEIVEITNTFTPRTIQVGYAVTQSVTTQYPNNDGTVTTFVGVVRGIITGIGKEELYVKITDRIDDATDTSTKISYKDPKNGANAFSLNPNLDFDIVDSTGTVLYNNILPDNIVDWYSQQKMLTSVSDGGSDNNTIYWSSIAEKPGTSQYAAERDGSDDEIHVVIVDDQGTVTGNAGQILEKFAFLSKASDGKVSPYQQNYYKNLLSERSQYVYFGAAPTGVQGAIVVDQNNNSAFTRISTSWGTQAQSSKFSLLGAKSYKLSGGVDYSSTNGMTPELSSVISSYNLFKNPAEYSIDYLISGPSGGDTLFQSQAKANSLITIAEERKDCIAVISPHKPDVVNVTSSQAQTESIVSFFDPIRSSSYAVFDSGYKYSYDRFNNKYMYLPCNPDVAGLMARTSLERYPWFSPAGAARGSINNAIKLAYNPSQSQRDSLYSKRINPIIASPGQGIILFGDKTALGYASAFDRINVRRLFLTIERAIEKASRTQLFEFNDEITRNNFLNIVEPYLRDVKAKRGITDFVVVCDETNNTPDVIDANEFKADIFVKPARSINFIGLTFVATRTGVSFSEVVGTV